MHSLKHFKSLHEHNVILTVRTADLPRIPEPERIDMEGNQPAVPAGDADLWLHGRA